MLFMNGEYNAKGWIQPFGRINLLFCVYGVYMCLRYAKSWSNVMANRAMFEDLISDENGNPVMVAYVGGDAFYVVNDNGFRGHVDAGPVDWEVVNYLVTQLQDNKELAIEQALRMMGQDDLFAKAALDASLSHVNIHEILNQGLPPQARDMLGLLGFRVVINYHGELIRLDQPVMPSDE